MQPEVDPDCYVWFILFITVRNILLLRGHENEGCMSEELGDGNLYAGFDLGDSWGQSYDELYIYMVYFMK